ncbi:MAG: DUF305 domain-containing protein [Gemmatimonadaceae bacterium]
MRFVAIVAVLACSATARQSEQGQVRPIIHGGAMTPAAQAHADSGRPAFTAADVRFMQGMIGHHTQALVMAALAPTNSARPDVRILAERIAVSQRDEIALMASWLRNRNLSVPDTIEHRHHAGMITPGMDTAGVLMPGMLTAAQLTQLRAATGPEFDRLFLTFMIQHHQGAVRMVSELLAVPGAAGNVDIYRFAADVNVDQTTEINRMRVMLAAASSGAPSR